MYADSSHTHTHTRTHSRTYCNIYKNEAVQQMLMGWAEEGLGNDKKRNTIMSANACSQTERRGREKGGREQKEWMKLTAK